MEGTLSDSIGVTTQFCNLSIPPASFSYEDVNADFVRALTQPTQHFLCKISDNWAKLTFGGFKMRDMVSGFTLVEVQDDEVDNDTLSDTDDPSTRVIKYHLGPDFLKLQTVGLTLKFSNGPIPIQDMLMVERHYFRGQVIRSYEFKFGFVIPNSQNSWEFIYNLPDLDEKVKAEIVKAPWEVKSDSFFFADGKLIIHNRAEYNYTPLDDE